LGLHQCLPHPMHIVNYSPICTHRHEKVQCKARDECHHPVPSLLLANQKSHFLITAVWEVVPSVVWFLLFKRTSDPGSNYFLNLKEPQVLVQGFLLIYYNIQSGSRISPSHFKTPNSGFFKN
jgi:hypothetical protein